MRLRNVIERHHHDAEEQHRGNRTDPIPVRGKNSILIGRAAQPSNSSEPRLADRSSGRNHAVISRRPGKILATLREAFQVKADAQNSEEVDCNDGQVNRRETHQSLSTSVARTRFIVRSSPLANSFSEQLDIVVLWELYRANFALSNDISRILRGEVSAPHPAFTGRDAPLLLFQQGASRLTMRASWPARISSCFAAASLAAISASCAESTRTASSRAQRLVPTEQLRSSRRVSAKFPAHLFASPLEIDSFIGDAHMRLNLQVHPTLVVLGFNALDVKLIKNYTGWSPKRLRGVENVRAVLLILRFCQKLRQQSDAAAPA